MRERVEDLGRIAQIVEQMLGLDLFEEPRCKAKDFIDFVEDNEFFKETFLRKIPYSIEEVKDGLYRISCIAEGRDDLNQRED